jgi:hypothetical protein
MNIQNSGLKMSNTTQLTKIYSCIPIFALMLYLLLPTSLSAQGLGITGNFSSQDFRLSPGESSTGIDAYVVVINTNETPIRVNVNTETPEGVTLSVAEYDFVLEVGGQKRLDITVQVGSQALLGEYTISIYAEAYREGDGIKVTGGGLQQATLTVVDLPPVPSPTDPSDSSTDDNSSLLPLLGGVGGGLLLVTMIVLWVNRRTHWFHLPGKGSQH